MRLEVEGPDITPSYKVSVTSYRKLGSAKFFYDRLEGKKRSYRRPVGRFRKLLGIAS